MARPLGIDLGTTFSLAAYVDERNRARTVPSSAGGSPLLPSAVAYAEDGAAEVGEAALAPGRRADVVTSVKRLMGRGSGDLGPAERALHPLDGEGAVVRLRVAGGRRAVTPVEVSAEILRALARAATLHLGEAPGGCVVTVPAYFDDAQRQATRDAGRLAGLEVVRLLNEPTAAAIAYGLDLRRRGRFAVFDLGGGTFDLSLLRLEDGVFEVLATGGDTHLGGDDLDGAVAGWLLASAGVDPAAAGGGLLRAALTAARRAREALTVDEAVAIEAALPGGVALSTRLARAQLEELIRPVIERTTAPCLAALRDAGLEPGALDGVVLVGGATRTPLVRRHVRDLFRQEPLTDLDPDAVVALGAAIQADALHRGGRDDLLLLDVIPLSLGVETMGGVVERLLHRNSTIPAIATQRFTTWADGQGGMVIHVVQGERELARDCRSLARFTLRGIPSLPAGQARVEITYAIDADGILSVAARELTTGLEQAVQVKPTYGLSEEEVERMLVESLEHASDDVTERFRVEWWVEGQRLLDVLAEALASDGDLLAPEERAALEERLAGLRAAMKGDDPLALRAWIDSADAAARPFMERRLDRHVGRALAGRRVDEL